MENGGEEERIVLEKMLGIKHELEERMEKGQKLCL